MRLLPLFALAFPVFELAVLIKVGSELGILLTFALLFAGVMAGSFLLRIAGPATLWRMRARLQSGERPEQDMLDGLMMALAGILLIFPGFISDLIAVFCLLPITRNLLLQRASKGRWQSVPPQERDWQQSRPSQSSAHQPQTLEGEWERRD